MASNRKMLKMLINKSAGYNVETADDGLEAVTVVLASPEKYDVIFMDNFMPVMVGSIATMPCHSMMGTLIILL